MDNITYQKLIKKFPQWMDIRSQNDPLNEFFQLAGTQLLHIEKSRQKFFDNSYLQTSNVDGDHSYYQYYLPSGEIGLFSLLSGECHDLPNSGEIEIIKLTPLYPEEYYPTRANFIENIELPISGNIMGLCYLDEIVSGSFMISWQEYECIKILTDEYEIIGSGCYCNARAEFPLEFDLLSGDIYRADLYHLPTNYEIWDVYGPNPLSGLYIEDDYAYIHIDNLYYLGRPLINMDYKLCDFIYRIKTDQYKWQYFYDSPQPDLLLANEIIISGIIPGMDWV